MRKSYHWYDDGPKRREYPAWAVVLILVLPVLAGLIVGGTAIFLWSR